MAWLAGKPSADVLALCDDEGVDLKMDYGRDTMRNIHKLWSRPVHLETVVDDKKRLISFDGKDFSERKID